MTMWRLTRPTYVFDSTSQEIVKKGVADFLSKSKADKELVVALTGQPFSMGIKNPSGQNMAFGGVNARITNDAYGRPALRCCDGIMERYAIAGSRAASEIVPRTLD